MDDSLLRRRTVDVTLINFTICIAGCRHFKVSEDRTFLRHSELAARTRLAVIVWVASVGVRREDATSSDHRTADSLVSPPGY